MLGPFNTAYNIMGARLEQETVGQLLRVGEPARLSLGLSGPREGKGSGLFGLRSLGLWV